MLLEFKYIIYEKSEGIATITINRPEALNAFSAEVVSEILQALEDVKACLLYTSPSPRD